MILPPKIYLLIGTFVAGSVVGATINGWRLNAKIDSMVAEHAQAVQAATVKAAEQTQQMQGEKDAAIQKAFAQVQRNMADAAAARGELDRLRDDLASSRIAMSDATPASLTAHAQALGDVLEQCTKEYLLMAEKADGHATDSAALFSAWTAIAGVK